MQEERDFSKATVDKGRKEMSKERDEKVWICGAVTIFGLKLAYGEKQIPPFNSLH